jgi:hypothetical protein
MLIIGGTYSPPLVVNLHSGVFRAEIWAAKLVINKYVNI